jgi:hypothetical protein
MKSSPPEVPIQVVTDTRPPSVASIRSAVSTRSSKSSSCGLQPENGEKLLIFRDEVYQDLHCHQTGIKTNLDSHLRRLSESSSDRCLLL